jgi:hypothetical protein
MLLNSAQERTVGGRSKTTIEFADHSGEPMHHNGGLDSHAARPFRVVSVMVS